MYEHAVYELEQLAYKTDASAREYECSAADAGEAWASLWTDRAQKSRALAAEYHEAAAVLRKSSGLRNARV